MLNSFPGHKENPSRTQTGSSGNLRFWPRKPGRMSRRPIVRIFMPTCMGAFFFFFIEM